MLLSFVYLVACRLFTLALLLARSDGSRELEIVFAAARVGDPAACTVLRNAAPSLARDAPAISLPQPNPRSKAEIIDALRGAPPRRRQRTQPFKCRMVPFRERLCPERLVTITPGASTRMPGGHGRPPQLTTGVTCGLRSRSARALTPESGAER